VASPSSDRSTPGSGRRWLARLLTGCLLTTVVAVLVGIVTHTAPPVIGGLSLLIGTPFIAALAIAFGTLRSRGRLAAYALATIAIAALGAWLAG